VAREDGIPAVLGTAVATRRIRSGQLIKVDGDAGTVTLREESEEMQQIEQVGRPRRLIIAGATGAAAAAGLAAWLIRRRRRD
jgi:pyruvate,water dikinase